MPSYSGYAGASSQTAYGTNVWADEAECVGAFDGTPADVSVQDTAGNHASYYLDASTFGFSVGGGETPTAITVQIRVRATSTTAWGPKLSCALLLPDATVSDFEPTQTITPDGTYRTLTFGGGTWGLSPSLLDSTVLSDAAFSVRMLATNVVLIPPAGSWAAVGIDSVHLSITTVPSTPFVDDTMALDQTLDEHWPPRRRYAFTY